LQNTSAPVVFATCAGWLLAWALLIRGLKPQQAIY
jgi:hypothetical protein